VIVGATGFLTAPFRSAWQRRQVLRELSAREVHGTFRGSLLGSGWYVLQPLAMLAVYAIVFGGILGAGAGLPYVVSLFTGMVVFQAFAEPVGRAPRLVVAQPNYVTKVVFPLDLLPWPPVALAAVHALTSCVLLLGLQLWAAGTLPWTAVLLPLALAPVLLLGLGLSWALAALGVYVRDTHEVVRVVVQLLFFLSPIVWTTDKATEGWQVALVAINPLAVAMETARASLTGAAWPSPGSLAWLFGAALLLPALGHFVFRRAKDGFADVL
jgi:lipopolysaccharide transport system permease protein